MACQESIEHGPNGERIPRYKNLIGDKIDHKPRLLMQWGRWACISHNARGEGDTLWQAYNRWHWQINQNTLREDRRRAQQGYHFP